MRIYNYDPETGEYLGEGLADESPLEPGVYLVPAYATTKPAPTLKSGQAAIWAGETWRVVPDYRGRSVCALDADGYYSGPAELALGENPDARRILADPPPADMPRPKWTGSTWIDGRTPAEILSAYTAAVQARLDQFAQSRGYDSGVSCASYAASTNATFKGEAGRFILLRDQTWSKCYAIMDAVKNGSRPMPTMAEIETELPPLIWN